MNLQHDRSSSLPERMAASHEPIRPRPRIGILSSSGSMRDGGWPVYAADAACVHAVFEAGGYPVIIPTFPLRRGYDPYRILTDHDAFEELFAVIWPVIHTLDGLLLAGGGDLYACLYGQAVHHQAGRPEGWRDVWERYFALMAWGLGMPTLGICRGMQVMNVIRGGGLFQDARAQWPKQMPPLLSHQARGRISADRWAEHPVMIEPTSRLAQMLCEQEERAPYRHVLDPVLSMHHQFVGYVTPQGAVVGSLAPGLAIGAIAPDGVIEAIEEKDPRRFWIGVQFHPEWVVSLRWALRLFIALIDASRAYARRRTDGGDVRSDVYTWLRLWDRHLLHLPVERPLPPTTTGALPMEALLSQANGNQENRR